MASLQINGKINYKDAVQKKGKREQLKNWRGIFLSLTISKYLKK